MDAEVDVQAVGVVAIGRNEGERLVACLRSIPEGVGGVVYVDSGSTDGSVEQARAHGVDVVELDMSIPFTAARARNAGIERLCALHPQVRFVQAVDGDCELSPGWIEAGLTSLAAHPEAAIVCGRRRERAPDASIYNRLCDMEWDTPVGEAEACGGDALIRLEALRAAGGYDPSLIAGEEPEMCLRIRRLGWKVLRIDRDMTLHDAQMTRLSQWFKRNLRAGHAYAEGFARYGDGPEAYCATAVRSNLFWGLALPAAALAAAPLTLGTSLGGLLGSYGVLLRRVQRDCLAKGASPEHATLYARYCVLGKLPQGLGVAQYYRNRLLGRRNRLIEYK